LAILLRVIFLLLIGCVSALGLVLIIPFVKEGSSWGDMPILAGMVGVALLLGLGWWLAVGRSLAKAMIGWLILSIPLIAHGSAMVSLLLARYEGWRLADTVEIRNYKETPILWPGFDGPIGLEVTLELHHAAGIKALILSPEIRMGPVLSVSREKLSASQTSGSGYLKNSYLDRPLGNLTLLKSVLFQKVFENPVAESPNEKWLSSRRFSESEVTPLAYALLPGTVDYLPDPKQICLNSRSYGIALCTAEQKPEMGCASKNYSPVTDPIYNLGSNLSALWIAAGAYDMTADLSSKLDAILRHESILQGKPTEWTEIQKRLEPKGLAAAGYRLCAPGPDSHTAFRTCYCLDD
jgi:hypothetical protein